MRAAPFVFALAATLAPLARAEPGLPASPTAWRDLGSDAIRGVTIGPIENGYHPGKGYGTLAFGRTLAECTDWGATWIALTPFGRVYDLAGTGVDPTFEAPFDKNVADVRASIRAAHERGLRVMLVPHLWVETPGKWRALIDPGTDEGWAQWEKSYGDFVKAWARVAEDEHADLFSAGVELRSWVTSGRATSFLDLIAELRGIYHGLITYSANWDDVDDTIVLGALDVIGINAFYPLASREGATIEELLRGGERVRQKVHKLATDWQKPVMMTEIGYTTRPDPAIKPWIWPDSLAKVYVDEEAQAIAYHALIKPLLEEPSFMGFFVWRVYADPDDVSQEAEWGFSPKGKLAELVVRAAFAATWAGDGATKRSGLLR